MEENRMVFQDEDITDPFCDIETGAAPLDDPGREEYKEMTQEATECVEWTAEELEKASMGAALKAETDGLEALSGEERRHYFRYLLGHVNKENRRGEAVKPIHANIVDLILLEETIFVLNQDLYIYDYNTGTYFPDFEGKVIKQKIRQYLDREFVEAKTLDAIYKLLLSDSRLAISQDKVNDRPAHWIHFLNGYYDFRSDTMHGHDPQYHEVDLRPHEYSPSRYPANRRFVTKGTGILRETVEENLIFDEWFENAIPNLEDRMMVLQYLGYAMTQDTSQQCFLVICGPGGTGKSTLLRLVEEIIGKKNVSSVSLQGLQDRWSAGQLYLKAANICADIGSTALTDIDVIKRLTGGDLISADRKFKDAFTFRPYCRLFFSANDVPYIPEATNAFYRRMLVLKMDQIPDEVDPHLTEKLIAEIPNIITKVCEELYCSEGMVDRSANCVAAVSKIRTDSDAVEAFLCDCCETDPDSKDFRTPRAVLYERYKEYCFKEGRTERTRQKFYKDLETKGYKTVKGGDRDFLGIKLLPENVISFKPAI